MPELPEVETIARGLSPLLAGRVIERVEVRRPKSVHGDPAAFVAAVAGQTLLAARRRAKLLLLDLSGGGVLAFHLKMTGRLFFPAPGLEPDKHTHLVFRLSPASASGPETGPDAGPDAGHGAGQNALFFHDSRTFGYCRFFASQDALAQWDFYATLGPEPLEIDAPTFAARFVNRRGKLKALLLNQTVIAGVGNIYADESLFRAGIRPETPAERLSHTQLTRLFAVLREVLLEAIAACGSSIRDYRDAQGNAGAFQNSFKVYGRGGEACVACGRKLVAVKVAGRTSVFCGGCQEG